MHHGSYLTTPSFCFHYEKYPQRKTFLFEEQTTVYLLKEKLSIEMFYQNTIEQLFFFVEQLDQIEVCLPNSRLLTGIPILAVNQNLRWNSNKTSLFNQEKPHNQGTLQAILIVSQEGLIYSRGGEAVKIMKTEILNYKLSI